jgi:hypothetical protein
MTRRPVLGLVSAAIISLVTVSVISDAQASPPEQIVSLSPSRESIETLFSTPLWDETLSAEVQAATAVFQNDSPADTEVAQDSSDDSAESTLPCRPPSTAPSPCSASHKAVFYTNDFAYLTDTDYSGHCLGDCWKLMPVECCGECGTLDVGGQLRMRYHHEVGMGQDIAGPGVLRFENTVHDIWLSRMRLYSNWKPHEHARIYVEGIFADVTDDDNTYAPRPIDRNYGDFLNAFVDLSPNDCLTFRLGRQELLYGAERLISPLDWANTRRTFEGLKLILRLDDWTVDSFYTHLVPVIPDRLDEADYRQAFYGTYATYTPCPNETWDLYYIGYDNEHPGSITSDFSLHTLGGRLYKTCGDWLYEMEGGGQFGRESGLEVGHEAAFATVGMGRKLSQHRWQPTVWFYYDYASGNAGGDSFNRFNHLFPLGHKYFGFIDAVQRSNIEAPNVLLTMKPHQKWDLLLWYWHFMANQAGDIVPSISATPAQSTTSKDLGDEVDLTARYSFGPRSNVLFGYSHFWRGDKILAPQDADFFYTQWELNF